MTAEKNAAKYREKLSGSGEVAFLKQCLCVTGGIYPSLCSFMNCIITKLTGLEHRCLIKPNTGTLSIGTIKRGGVVFIRQLSIVSGNEVHIYISTNQRLILLTRSQNHIPQISTLKWKKREEGYIKKTPAGSSIIIPASQMTSQHRSELLKLPRQLC